MKKIDLGQTLNTLANVGVIAGIVFLAVELNQNNEFLELEARATLSEYSLEFVKFLDDRIFIER